MSAPGVRARLVDRCRCCVCGRRTDGLNAAGACVLCAGTDAAGVAWSYSGSVRVAQPWWQAAWPVLAVAGTGAAGLVVWFGTRDVAVTMGVTVGLAVTAGCVDHVAVVASRRRADAGFVRRLVVAGAVGIGAGLWWLGTVSPTAAGLAGVVALVLVVREDVRRPARLPLSRWVLGSGRPAPTSPAAAVAAPVAAPAAATVQDGPSEESGSRVERWAA